MSPSDFLKQLNSLPSDTPLTIEHISAILEVLQVKKEPEKAPDQNYSSWDDLKVIDQVTLGEWINESPKTLEKWRMNKTGPQATYKTKRVGYQVGHVKEWLRKNTHASNIAHQTAKQEELNAALTGKRPRKLEMMGMQWDQVEAIIYVDEQPLPFFESLEEDMNVTGYAVRWSQSESLASNLIAQFKNPTSLLKNAGIDWNEKNFFLVNGKVQTRTLAHILADSGLESEQFYTDILFDLLARGMDVTEENADGKTALELAEQVGNDVFIKSVQSFHLKRMLEEELQTKSCSTLR